MRRLISVVAVTLLSFTVMGSAHAVQNEVTPSTNEINTANGWAHFTADSSVGQAEVTFVQPRAFVACFEVRIDGAPATSPDNWNPAVTDGLWDYYCVTDSTQVETFSATDKIEIRMVFGAERDERFDWTTVEVPTGPTKDDCKNGGWEARGFENQGQCIATIEANVNAGK
jgi:hypothetical protein